MRILDSVRQAIRRVIDGPDVDQVLRALAEQARPDRPIIPMHDHLARLPVLPMHEPEWLGDTDTRAEG